jgi:hypothetical protein
MIHIEIDLSSPVQVNGRLVADLIQDLLRSDALGGSGTVVHRVTVEEADA